MSKISLRTCQNTLIKLERNKILKSKTEGKNKYFSLPPKYFHFHFGGFYFDKNY